LDNKLEKNNKYISFLDMGSEENFLIPLILISNKKLLDKIKN
jgi:hypothetical protein